MSLRHSRISRFGWQFPRVSADSCRHRLSVGGSEKMQLTALLAAFKLAVELSQKESKA